MKISVLIPSRQRAAMLAEHAPSWKTKDTEVLVAVDEDDPELDLYKQILGIRLFVTPKHGYENLHEYYNFLCTQAKGNWLMLSNDDSFMITKDWVQKIAKFDHTIPQVLNPWDEVDNLFPLISRAWYEAVGYFALNTHADSWVQQVAEIDGRTTYVPGIDIKHYGEELNDATHTRVREVVRQTSEAYRRMGEQRLDDARKISDYINRGGWHESHN